MELKLQTTALIYGTLALVIFVFPYFAYAKEFFEDNGATKKGEYLEMVGKVAGLHLTFLFFAIVFTSIVEIMMSYRPEFTPSNALTLFFQTNKDWENLIELLVNYKTTVSDSGSSSSSAVNTALGYQTVLNYYGIVVAFLMIAIPILVIVMSISPAMQKDQNGGESKISDKIFTASISYVFITFLVWAHALFSSTYVSIFTDVDFSFYKIMANLWHLILLG